MRLWDCLPEVKDETGGLLPEVKDEIVGLFARSER